MKKVWFVVGLVVSTILVSGCFFNQKTVTCTRESSESGMKSSEKVVAKIKDDKLKTLDMEMHMDMSGEEQASIDATYNLVKPIYEGFKAEGIEPVVSKSDAGIDVAITFDFAKASEESLSKMDSTFADMKSEKLDAEEYKKGMESEGYTCK